MRWPGDAHLPGQQHVLLQDRTAGEAGLRADDVVFADHAGVADLHQAVDLRAALHARFAHGGAVDRGQALDLDIVFDHRDAGLHDFVVRAVGALGESEAIAADDHAVLQNHAMADAAELAHHGMGMRQEIVADLRAFVDHDVRMQHGVRGRSTTFSPTATKAPMDAPSPIRRRCGNRRRRVNARRGPRRLVEQLQRAREIEIRVGRNQRRQDPAPASRRGSRWPWCSSAWAHIWVGEEGEMAGLPLLHPGTPVISISASPKTAHPRAAAISRSFMRKVQVSAPAPAGRVLNQAQIHHARLRAPAFALACLDPAGEAGAQPQRREFDIRQRSKQQIAV